MRRILIPIIFFLLLGFQALAQEQISTLEGERRGSEPFRIIGLEDRPAMKNAVEQAAAKARVQIASQTDADWEGTAVIAWVETETFQEKTGMYPENTAAAASPSRLTIWINEGAWVRSEPEDRQETMTHEMAHLLVGALPGGHNVPVWVQEGLAMHLADQRNIGDGLAVYRAHLTGNLPELGNLERSWPIDGSERQLAYDYAYQAIASVAQSYGDQPGEVRRLLNRMDDPVKGPALAEEFWDDFRREGWQRQIENQLGSKISSGLILFSMGTTFWILIAVLVIIAFVVKSRRNAEITKREEEEEEPWAASLTDDDIQDIYGDREDRWD